MRWVLALREVIVATPLRARVAPLLIFLALTAAQGAFGDHSRYWVYLLKSVLGAGLLWLVWPAVAEMRWRFSLDACAVGILVFVVWVGAEGYYLPLTAVEDQLVGYLRGALGMEPTMPSAPAVPWNPHLAFGQDSALAWLCIVGRIAGSSLVVPPLEEMFYRSFLYRFLAAAKFESIPLLGIRIWPFLIGSIIFGAAHREWLPGIFCGAMYQWLVCRHGRLGEAMTAHAITNFLLGLWVVSRGAWVFW
jgi:hypothetical protein